MTELEERVAAKRAGMTRASAALLARLQQAKQHKQMCHYRMLALTEELADVRETYHMMCGQVAALEECVRLVGQSQISDNGERKENDTGTQGQSEKPDTGERSDPGSKGEHPGGGHGMGDGDLPS